MGDVVKALAQPIHVAEHLAILLRLLLRLMALRRTAWDLGRGAQGQGAPNETADAAIRLTISSPATSLENVDVDPPSTRCGFILPRIGTIG